MGQNPETLSSPNDTCPLNGVDDTSVEMVDKLATCRMALLLRDEEDIALMSSNNSLSLDKRCFDSSSPFIAARGLTLPAESKSSESTSEADLVQSITGVHRHTASFATNSIESVSLSDNCSSGRSVLCGKDTRTTTSLESFSESRPLAETAVNSGGSAVYMGSERDRAPSEKALLNLTHEEDKSANSGSSFHSSAVNVDGNGQSSPVVENTLFVADHRRSPTDHEVDVAAQKHSQEAYVKPESCSAPSPYVAPALRDMVSGGDRCANGTANSNNSLDPQERHVGDVTCTAPAASATSAWSSGRHWSPGCCSVARMGGAHTSSSASSSSSLIVRPCLDLPIIAAAGIAARRIDSSSTAKALPSTLLPRPFIARACYRSVRPFLGKTATAPATANCSENSATPSTGNAPVNTTADLVGKQPPESDVSICRQPSNTTSTESTPFCCVSVAPDRSHVDDHRQSVQLETASTSTTQSTGDCRHFAQNDVLIHTPPNAHSDRSFSNGIILCHVPASTTADNALSVALKLRPPTMPKPSVAPHPRSTAAGALSADRLLPPPPYMTHVVVSTDPATADISTKSTDRDQHTSAVGLIASLSSSIATDALGRQSEDVRTAGAHDDVAMRDKETTEAGMSDRHRDVECDTAEEKAANANDSISYRCSNYTKTFQQTSVAPLTGNKRSPMRNEHGQHDTEEQREFGSVRAEQLERGKVGGAEHVVTSQRDNAETRLHRPQQETEVISLKKGVYGLGFCIEGGRDCPTGRAPVTVKRIFRG